MILNKMNINKAVKEVEELLAWAKELIELLLEINKEVDGAFGRHVQ